MGQSGWLWAGSESLFWGPIPLHLMSYMGWHLACSPGTRASRGGGPSGARASGCGRRGGVGAVHRRPELAAASGDGRRAWEDGGVRGRASPRPVGTTVSSPEARRRTELPSGAGPAQAGLRRREAVTPTRAPARCLRQSSRSWFLESWPGLLSPAAAWWLMVSSWTRGPALPSQPPWALTCTSPDQPTGWLCP